MINPVKYWKNIHENKGKRRAMSSVPLFVVSLVVIVVFLLMTIGPVNLLQSIEQSVYAATLRTPSAIPSNNLVSTTSTYEITFNTATAGAIKTVKITFPDGYNIAGTKLVEKEGIGAGSINVVGNTLTYNVNSPVNNPVGSLIRLELSNIVNKITTASSSVSISTNNANGVIIDGPTTVAVPLKQIGTGDIANNAVTNTKISSGSITSQKILDGQITAEKLSPTLMYTKRLLDSNCVSGEPGGITGPIGWCPSGQPGNTHFIIKDDDLQQVAFNQPKNILVSFPGTNTNCWANTGASDPRFMFVDCAQPPVDGASITYTVIGPKVLENRN
jgi:hypothetical protein